MLQVGLLSEWDDGNMADAPGKTNLLNLNRQDMETFFAQLGEKAFRASQVMKWIYHYGVDDFDAMTNLSKVLRTRLKECAEITLPEVIAEHPAVLDVSVAGVSDPVTAEAVKAWVVLSPGAQVSEAELKSFCKEKLSGYKVPKTIEFRETLPKSMVGKTLRRELQAETE